MRLYARNRYLICEPYELTNTSSNSLLIQNANTNKTAKVVDDCGCHSCCEINDIVLYDEDKAKEYMLNGNKYIIVHNDDIFAVVGEEK